MNINFVPCLCALCFGISVNFLSCRILLVYEPHHGKTIFWPMQKQTQIGCAVTAQLISAFVFAARIVLFFIHLYSKLQASSHLLILYRLVCVRPGWKPLRLVLLHCGSYESVLTCSIGIIIFWFHYLSNSLRKTVFLVSYQV